MSLKARVRPSSQSVQRARCEGRLESICAFLTPKAAASGRVEHLNLVIRAIDEDPVRGAEDVLIVERIKELLLD